MRGCADRLDENFVCAYGDVFLDFDARRLVAAHETSPRLGTLLVRASDHPWDSHLVVADAAGRVVEFIDRREPGRLYRNVANAAVHVLSHRVLDFIPAGRPADLGADVFPAAIAAGETLGVHFLEEDGFVKDMGTPERLAAVGEYLADRARAEAARAQPQPIETLFLDRDGVLTVDSGPVDRPEKLALLPGVAEAAALLRRRGIRCVVTTNQPVVARGLCTAETLEAIHDRLRAEIAAGGGRLDAIYVCPHHPETHYGGSAGIAPGLPVSQTCPGDDLSGLPRIGSEPGRRRDGGGPGLRRASGSSCRHPDGPAGKPGTPRSSATGGGSRLGVRFPARLCPGARKRWSGPPMIISKTPFRISFVGGGSDLPDFYQRGYGAVVSSAIDKFVYLALHEFFYRRYLLKYAKPRAATASTPSGIP